MRSAAPISGPEVPTGRSHHGRRGSPSRVRAAASTSGASFALDGETARGRPGAVERSEQKACERSEHRWPLRAQRAGQERECAAHLCPPPTPFVRTAATSPRGVDQAGVDHSPLTSAASVLPHRNVRLSTLYTWVPVSSSEPIPTPWLLPNNGGAVAHRLTRVLGGPGVKRCGVSQLHSGAMASYTGSHLTLSTVVLHGG